MLCIVASKTKAYELVEEHIATVLITSFMEIIHPIFGWVRTDPLMATIQVSAGSSPISGAIVSAQVNTIAILRLNYHCSNFRLVDLLLSSRLIIEITSYTEIFPTIVTIQILV